MDKLLRQFYTTKLYIDISFADEAQVALLEDILNVKWSSGPRLSYKTQHYKNSRCYIYTNFIDSSATDHEIERRLKLADNVVYKTQIPSQHTQIMKIQEFIDYFGVTTLKPVSETEIEVLWG